MKNECFFYFKMQLLFFFSVIENLLALQNHILFVSNMRKLHSTLILALIITGATNTIFLALQNKQRIPEEPFQQNQKFFHPFIQLALMFIGEILCFIPYLVIKLVRRKKNLLEISGFMKKQCPFYLPMIPGFTDLFGSGLSYFALNLISSSVWQISKGGVIITTAIFSKIFLHKKFDKNTVFGCLLTFVGITLVQLFQILFSEEKMEGQNSVGEQIVGIILLFVSLIFTTATLVSQKIIFNKYTINPLKMVFIEGIFGLIGISIVILFAANFQCPSWGSIQDKCLYVDGKLYMESVSVFFSQISYNKMLVLLIILFLFSISISVPIAVTISKVINPISRTLADVCRTVLIWGFGIIITLSLGKDDEQYNLEETGIQLNLFKVGGFILVVLGTLIYHDVIQIKKKGFRQNQESLLLSEEAERNIDNYIEGDNKIGSTGSLQASNFNKESLT